jgi:Kef-type K+ transport systems, membrane components
MHNIAELGVVFLLFTIGLELKVDRLKLIRNQTFGVGTAQVVVTSVVIALIGLAAGFSVYYCDASRTKVLQALGFERARAAVIILDNAVAAERVVYLLHTRFPNLKI